MIVNPQLFNYRLITGSLIVAVAVLSILSVNSYQEAQATQEFLEQERKLISYELKEIIGQYDMVAVENEELQAEISSVKASAEAALDSIEVLQGDIKVYRKYRNQVSSLKQQNQKLLSAVEQLEKDYKSLEEDNAKTLQLLKAEQLETENLKSENAELESSLEVAARLRASNFQVKAFSFNKGERVETKRAINAENIEVCLTILDNELTEVGSKDLYIQIVGPSNNVLADKGAVNFDEASLIYSAKNTFYYNHELQDVCVSVKADNTDKPLEKGVYYISVFNGPHKIASSQLTLD